MTETAKRFQEISSQIQSAASGRSITLVGVTKFQAESVVKEALTAGLSHLGVNYVQEGEALRLALKEQGSIQWHFIGKIQSRKVKSVAKYDWIHSIERLEIAEALEDLLAKENRKISALIEVNIGQETSKSGVSSGALIPFAERLAKFKHLQVRGLMALPPPLESVTQRAANLGAVVQLYHKGKQAFGWDTLSLGTSDDYREAIQAGSTLVRLGTALFGSRSA